MIGRIGTCTLSTSVQAMLYLFLTNAGTGHEHHRSSRGLMERPFSKDQAIAKEQVR